VSPNELGEIQNRVHHLDEEYWNGSDTSVTDAINDLADFVESIRAAWMSGRGSWR
jgi:hypothetical protein